jgi:hypothetical protein
VGKPDGKRLLGRPRRRCADNIDLIEIGWDGMDRIDLAQDRDQWKAVVNTVMNLRVPQNAGKFLSSCTIGGFSRRAQLHKVNDERTIAVTITHTCSKSDVRICNFEDPLLIT